MQTTRFRAYLLNVVFLLAFAVAATLANPVNTDPVVGFGVVFLAILFGVYVLHWAFRKRPSALKAVRFLAVVGAFIALSAMGNHVAIGLAAAALMLIDVSVVRRHPMAVYRSVRRHPVAVRRSVRLEDDSAHDPAGSAAEFEVFLAWRDKRAAGPIH